MIGIANIGKSNQNGGMDIMCRQIRPEETHFLRHKILRPHQYIEEMVYPLDQGAGSFHVGAFAGDRLIGVVSVYPESQEGELHQGEWRIRGMAVDTDIQGQGVGEQLVHTCIDRLKSLDAVKVWCNARTSAIGFYFRLGFEPVGEEFEIEGIGPHYVAQIIFTP